MQVDIIVNPAAGHGNGNHAARKLEASLTQFGARVNLHTTVRAGDAARFASRLGDSDVILAVGGDGTLNEILNGMVDSDRLALGQFPLGTANVLAKALKLPSDAVALAQLVMDGSVRPMDTVLANEDRRFLLMASAGFDAWVVHALHGKRQGPIHMLQYPAIAVALLKDWQSWNIEVAVDGALVTSRASQVVLANVAAYGGPLRMVPEADADDGLLDVLCFLGRGRLDMMRLFSVSSMASADRLDDVILLRGERVVLRGRPAKGSCPCPVQMDGEPFGHTPVSFRILPKSVRMIAPDML